MILREYQLKFSLSVQAASPVVLRTHKAVTITDPQVYFSIFIKYIYMLMILPNQREKEKWMGILEMVGSRAPIIYCLTTEYTQAAIPEFTNVKHSQDRVCCVYTAWHTLSTDATNITSLLQGCAIFGGLIRVVQLSCKEGERNEYWLV